jgi:hypothetical protein
VSKLTRISVGLFLTAKAQRAAKEGKEQDGQDGQDRVEDMHCIPREQLPAEFLLMHPGEFHKAFHPAYPVYPVSHSLRSFAFFAPLR